MRAAVEKGKMKAWQRTGNVHADKMAKVGAQMHPQLEAIIDMHERATKLCVLISKHIGRTLALVHKGGAGFAQDPTIREWV